MGCGCGKGKTNEYIVTHPDGKTETYTTRTAATAAVRRTGGKATMKVAEKV